MKQLKTELKEKVDILSTNRKNWKICQQKLKNLIRGIMYEKEQKTRKYIFIYIIIDTFFGPPPSPLK